MKVGEIWKLKSSVAPIPTDQINIQTFKDGIDYDLVPALRIININWNEDNCMWKMWKNEYVITYRIIFGLDTPNESEEELYNMMNSKCLLRNFEKQYESR